MRNIFTAFINHNGDFNINTFLHIFRVRLHDSDVKKKKIDDNVVNDPPSHGSTKTTKNTVLHMLGQ